MIADGNRAFEAACGVNEISLNNIWQARVITANGDLVRASASDLDMAAARALEGAQWNVDPSGIAPELQGTWQQVEFGNFAPAASTLKRYLRSRKPQVKSSANALNDYVSKQLKAQLDAAASADSSGDEWEAWKILTSVQQRFKGYEIPETVSADVTRLEKTDEVASELEAWKQLEQARKSAASRSAVSRQRAVSMLQKLTEESPGTEAAAEAQAILESLAPPQGGSSPPR